VTADSLLDRVRRLPFTAPGDPAGVPAAVLIALSPVDGADDLRLVLVQRPDHMRTHAGQVALPGGGVEPGDRDGAAAALREAEEEVGLDRRAVRVLGSLGRSYLPVSNFDVLPVVGLWDGRAVLRPNPAEVAAILRPTLRQLADPANHELVRLTRLLPPEVIAAREVPAGASSPAFNVDGTVVWGFTAGLLAEFLRRLGLAAPPFPPEWARPPRPA
jgi:8-oxo-dGTP pyrophosphatase MutT (NUDIX family)